MPGLKTCSLILIGLLMFAVAITAQVAASPPAQSQVVTTDPPPAVIDQVPESATKDTVLWWASVGGNVLSTYLKWNSSWKQPAADFIHAEPSGLYAGKYYVRASIYDWGLVGISTTVQYFLCRKFPTLKKTFTYVNFGQSGIALAQYGFNATNH